MTVLLIPNGQQVFLDNNGNPLQFGTVEMYVPATLTPKNTWQDQAQSALNLNPIPLDGGGRCTIWGAGDYRQIVKDSLGNVVWDTTTTAGTGQNVYWGGLSGGAPNDQTLSIPSFVFVDGATVQWIALFTNTAALSVTINGVTYDVFANSASGASPLIGGEIIAGNIVTMVADTSIGGFRLTSSTATIRNLNILGTFIRSGVLTIAPLSTSIDDFDPPGIENSSAIRIASTIPINWSGLNAPSSEAYYTVDNYGTQPITLLAQSGLSAAGNQFLIADDFLLGPNTSAEFHYDTTSAGWRIIGSGIGARTQLLANRTYFVSTTGSNSNDGLAAGRPFLTLQKALDTITPLDLNGFSVTIQLADGTYTDGGIVSELVGQLSTAALTIQGNIGNPANVIINAATGDALKAQSGGKCFVTGVEFRSVAGNGIYALDRANIDVGVVRFGACASDHVQAEGYAEVKFQSSYTIAGSAASHWFAFDHAICRVTTSITITLTGTPAFSQAFALTSLYGLEVFSNIVTFSGAATGTRYNVALTSAVAVNGSGATYLPGNVAGTGAGSYF